MLAESSFIFSLGSLCYENVSFSCLSTVSVFLRCVPAFSWLCSYTKIKIKVNKFYRKNKEVSRWEIKIKDKTKYWRLFATHAGLYQSLTIFLCSLLFMSFIWSSLPFSVSGIHILNYKLRERKVKTLTRNWKDHRTGTHKHTETVSRYFDWHSRLSQLEESKCLWTHDKDCVTRDII
jgi:hypothetical protein